MTSSQISAVDNPRDGEPPGVLAAEIADYFDRLWPILRSITGEGARKTHRILSEIIPLETSEVPSGTQCLDWTVPQEWVVREAYVVTPNGDRILDVTDNNLHLVNYSAPFRGHMMRDELDSYLHSLPELPEAIPYVTSYYAPNWGFCISHEMREQLPSGRYEIVVDTELIDGSMTISEAVLPGREKQEVLISTYTCHPAMANNELSGPLVAAFLYRYLAEVEDRRLTYRFVFVPETIGSIAYLSKFGDRMKANVAAGFVVTCVGDPGPFTYKRSRRGDSLADRAAENVLHHWPGQQPNIIDFFPGGSDERQYCSPGFNLPVGVLARSWPGRYPEYHTSLDNRDFISFEAMAESVDAYLKICRTLDRNVVYDNQCPYGEPQLGKHGLMDSFGAARDRNDRIFAIKWVMNMCDGEIDLLRISERSGLEFDLIAEMAQICCDAGLLSKSAS